MDVLLVNPPNLKLKINNLRMVENVGICYLAAALKKEGFSVGVLDCRIKGLSEKEAMLEILEMDFKVLGISVPFQEILFECMGFAKVLRQMGVNAHITLGGHPPSFLYKEILETEPSIDSVIIGEGETTIVELLRNLEDGMWKSLDGIAYRDGQGKAVKNKERCLIRDLDDLPPAYRYIFEKGYPPVTPLDTFQQGLLCKLLLLRHTIFLPILPGRQVEGEIAPKCC